MTAHESLWREDDNVTARALSVARRVTAEKGAVDDLKRYYRVESNYAGATFANLRPNDPDRITPADLLATSMLSVSIPAITVRRLTGDSATARHANALLQELGPQLDITAARDQVQTMSDFYQLVKSSLAKVGTTRSNAWVTASKICARKRPHLFPVRDRIVVQVLGLKNSYPDDWPVFAALMADAELADRIDELVVKADEEDTVDVGDTSMRLKHLDVLLWMHGTRRS